MERPSDIQGLVYIPFENKISEAAQLLAREIESKLNVTIPASKL
jgi:predicted nucleotide-binding protein